MTTLTQLTLDADGSIGLDIEHDAGTGSPFFSHCNDDPTSSSADWVANDQTEMSDTARFRLTDVNSDFGSMDTLNIDVDVQAISFSDDTCGLKARIFDADNDNVPLTSETVDIATQADTTRTQRTVEFAGLSGTKAQWNTAYIRFVWAYSKTGQGDNGQLKLFGCDIDGTYTISSGATVPLMFNHYAKRRRN